MRVLIAGQTYRPPRNGAAVFTVHLAEGLVRAGHEVLVLAPSDGRRAYQSVMNGVRVQTVPALSLAPFYPEIHVTLRPGPQVTGIIDRFRPQVVHLQDHYPLSRAALQAARARGVPVVGTNNFLPANMATQVPLLRHAQAPLERLIWRTVSDVFDRVQVVTVATRAAAAILRPHIAAPIQIISNGVDLMRFHPGTADPVGMRRRYGLDPNRPVVIYVGRLDADKQVEVLLRAMYRRGHDGLQLAIAGRGRHMAALQSLATRLALGDRVVFTGFVPDQDLQPLLASVDLFAMPGAVELQCLAALEAMACGRPVLLADSCALPELVDEGVNGYLFRPGDDHHAAERLDQLLAERSRWPEMGQASIAKARPHSLENTVRSYERLYESLVRDTVMLEVAGA